MDMCLCALMECLVSVRYGDGYVFVYVNGISVVSVRYGDGYVFVYVNGISVVSCVYGR
jgi:phage-related protein